MFTKSMILSMCVVVFGAWVQRGEAAKHVDLERIEECHSRCSQGLRCKAKRSDLFARQCVGAPQGVNGSAVSQNVSFSPVMSCAGRQKCSLHLRVSVSLQMAEGLTGVSICAQTPGMLAHCHSLSFSRAARRHMVGQQVEAVSDCFDVSAGQEVHVSVKTQLSDCHVTLSSTYHTPDCSHPEMRSNIPECITGRLSYTVDPGKKEVNVAVSDMREDKDYFLRLCLKDYDCRDTSSTALIRREDPMKNATLQYSSALPCLCIEGWSLMTDALRTQICPFKERLEELWTGMTYDPMQGALHWEAACPVTAVISLCQQSTEGGCSDLPGSSQSFHRGKVTFKTVEQHPQLCMKFTVGSRFWIRCPFAEAFQAAAWELDVTISKTQQEAVMSSRVDADFSVGTCVKSGESPVCQPTYTHIIHVGKLSSARFNLTEDSCKPGVCIQIKRVDVKYATTVLQCHTQCEDGLAQVQMVHQMKSVPLWGATWILVSVVTCVTVFIICMLIVLTVHQRKQKRKGLAGLCSTGKHAESLSVLSVGLTAAQPYPTPHEELSTTESPKLWNLERANLLSV